MDEIGAQIVDHLREDAFDHRARVGFLETSGDAVGAIDPVDGDSVLFAHVYGTLASVVIRDPGQDVDLVPHLGHVDGNPLAGNLGSPA